MVKSNRGTKLALLTAGLLLTTNAMASSESLDDLLQQYESALPSTTNAGPLDVSYEYVEVTDDELTASQTGLNDQDDRMKGRIDSYVDNYMECTLLAHQNILATLTADMQASEDVDNASYLLSYLEARIQDIWAEVASKPEESREAGLRAEAGLLNKYTELLEQIGVEEASDEEEVNDQESDLEGKVATSTEATPAVESLDQPEVVPAQPVENIADFKPQTWFGKLACTVLPFNVTKRAVKAVGQSVLRLEYVPKAPVEELHEDQFEVVEKDDKN
jgi:hypothetical protein